MRKCISTAFSFLFKENRLLVLTLALLVAFSFGSYAIGAALYHPSDNVTDPGCSPGASGCYVDILPDQTSNVGKFLQTDGTATSWQTAMLGSVAAGEIAYGQTSNVLASTSDFVYNTTSSLFRVQFNGFPYLTADAGSGSYRLGDTASQAGGIFMDISDATKTTTFNGSYAANGPTSFIGSGLNDVSLAGTYLGAATTTFTLTIDGTNRQRLTYGTLTGTFQVGETLTGGTSLATGMIVTNTGSSMIVQVSSGTFQNGEVVTGSTSGAHAVTTAVTAKGDTVSFTDTNGHNNYSNTILGTSNTWSYGMSSTAGATTGHTIGDHWSITATVTGERGLTLEHTLRKYSLGDPTSGSAYVTANGSSNVVTIHGSGGTCTFTGASSGGTCFSDQRLKTNVQNFDDALSDIKKLRPVTFEWNDPSMPKGTNIGFIAQEVQQVFPEYVNPVSDTGYLGVSYEGFIVPAIRAIQQLDMRVEALEAGSGGSSSSSVASMILSFLQDAVLSIKEATIGILHIGGKVCVDDICVTKDQFKNLLIQAGGVSETPPAPPSDTPPADSSSSSTPPADTDTPPAEETAPPADSGSGEEVTPPPTDTPPADTPPVDETPAAPSGDPAPSA